MTTVLVTGAGGPAAANFVRSLRMQDSEEWTIVGVDVRPEHLHATAGLDHRYLVPSADDNTYLAALARICHAHDVDLVHPQPDVEVAAITAAVQSGEWAKQVGARTFLPPAPVVLLCQDKMACQRQLERAGVAVPRSHACGAAGVDPAQFRQLAARSHQGSVWIRARRGAGSRAALPVSSTEQANAWIRYWAEERGLNGSQFMICEHVPGDEYAFQSLWYEGSLVVSAARRRVEYLFGHLTASGQTSTPALAVSVHDDAVNDTAAAAVRAVTARPHGVFCVDLKEDASGSPRVTEINAGRFFTTSDFFAAAGANMPAAYVALASGRRLPPLPRTNAVPAGMWWVRNIDKPAVLVPDAEWNVISRQAARSPTG